MITTKHVQDVTPTPGGISTQVYLATHALKAALMGSVAHQIVRLIVVVLSLFRINLIFQQIYLLIVDQVVKRLSP